MLEGASASRRWGLLRNTEASLVRAPALSSSSSPESSKALRASGNFFRASRLSRKGHRRGLSQEDCMPDPEASSSELEQDL